MVRYVKIVKKTGKIRRKVKRTTAKATASFKKSVAKVVNSMSEKQPSNSIKNNALKLSTFDYIAPISPTMVDLTQPLDGIPKGSDQGERQGNSIRLAKLHFSGIISQPQLTDGTSIDIVGKFVIAKLKASVELPSTADFDKLIQNGNASERPDGRLAQQFAPFNRDVWDIKKTIPFKLNSDSEVMLPKPGYGQYRQFKIDLSKYLPNKVVYGDVGGTTNCKLVGFVLLAQPDLTTGGPITQVVLDSTSWAEFYDL